MIAFLDRFRGIASWAGLFAGGFAWYAAHDLSFYLVRHNCATSHVIGPLIHVVALIIALGGGFISYREMRRAPVRNADAYTFGATVGFAAALLLSVVIVWQGIATLVYTGCER